MNIRRCCVVALASALGAAACTQHDDNDFATKAAQAGYAEVAAGQLASSQGQSPQVKSFAQHMVSDHTKANQDLGSVAAKISLQLPNGPSDAQKRDADDLAQKQGADFDKAYAKMMVDDHEDAVSLFRKEAESGTNADLKAFAQRTLPTLEQHLQMAKDLANGAQAAASTSP
ncbi:MAG TPA: DUF4142 domain-containing protein [Dokdonella sp.]